jgi:hypothetical protein
MGENDRKYAKYYCELHQAKGYYKEPSWIGKTIDGPPEYGRLFMSMPFPSLGRLLNGT